MRRFYSRLEDTEDIAGFDEAMKGSEAITHWEKACIISLVVDPPVFADYIKDDLTNRNFVQGVDQRTQSDIEYGSRLIENKQIGY